ncbi:general odorant-binding protein 66-like [Ochlerotatus camptorhynchus]|uniref:general odorant-binding protein 66-like n=1 Tax=Ochlerotatus camptorhynchus TaxID=644619 RepID=UPI0031DDD6A7
MNLLLIYCITLCFCGRICFAKKPCSEGPPVEKNPSECCDTPSVIDPPIMMNCFQKWGEQTKRQSKIDGIPRGCCVAECAMNATKLLSNGLINREKARKLFLTPVKGKPEWQPIVSATLEECFQQADDNMAEIEAGAKLKPSYKGEKICHPISGSILRCMSMKLFTKCPSDLFKTGSDCDQLKAYHEKCPLN